MLVDLANTPARFDDDDVVVVVPTELLLLELVTVLPGVEDEAEYCELLLFNGSSLLIGDFRATGVVLFVGVLVAFSE